MNLRTVNTVKWAQCDKTQSREIRNVRTAHLSVLMTVHNSVHNTTQNSSDNLPSYLQTNSSDVVHWRRWGYGQRHKNKTQSMQDHLIHHYLNNCKNTSVRFADN